MRVQPKDAAKAAAVDHGKAAVGAGTPDRGRNDEHGTVCDYCALEKDSIVGVLFPSAVDGDDSRAWIQRCDLCAIYESDEAAAQALVDAGQIAGWTSAPVDGLSRSFPYEVGSKVRSHPDDVRPTVSPVGKESEGTR